MIDDVTDDVLEVWAKASIPTRLKKHVVDKIECLFREYEKLKKNKENKTKRSEALVNKEQEWKSGLDELFDIAHVRALRKTVHSCWLSVRKDGEGRWVVWTRLG